MNTFLDPGVIKEFRSIANENRLFRNRYRNIDNRNKWSIVCSAMDWISVTARGIEYISFSNTHGSDDYLSLVLMQYIVAIDVVIQAIIQLYRVLYGNSFKYPLSGDTSIFHKKIPDDDYFKHIRAVFSTHPVDLHSIDGCIEKKEERFFASWSCRAKDGENDFIVYLYSNMPENDEFYKFGIIIDDINRYCSKRYDLLRELATRIKAINSAINQEYKLVQIETSDDILNKIAILIQENNKRIGDSYGYTQDLYYLKDIFDAYQMYCPDDPIIKYYINMQIEQVEKIKDSLQNMDFNFLVYEPEYISNFKMQKIHEFLNSYDPYGEDCFWELVSKGFLPEKLLYNQDKKLMRLYLDAYVDDYHKEYGCPFDVDIILKKETPNPLP